MEQNGWIIEGFLFEYKKNSYIVLAKLYLKTEVRPKYALLKTEFIKVGNSSKSLTIPLNTNGFITDPKTLRQFFEIEYAENLGDILQQFNEYFSKFIPMQVNPIKADILKKSIISSLSHSDSEDPEKIYCFNVRRNSNGHRTPFNDNKTKMLRPNLYSRFSYDSTVSFCYSKEKHNERTDEQILLSFSNKT